MVKRSESRGKRRDREGSSPNQPRPLQNVRTLSIERTIAFWSTRSPSPISKTAAEEALSNFQRLLDVLAEWERESRDKGKVTGEAAEMAV